MAFGPSFGTRSFRNFPEFDSCRHISEILLHKAPWNKVNTTANKIVAIEPCNDPFLSPFINE